MARTLLELNQLHFFLSGEDMLSLLYALLDEFLFRFTTDDCLVCKEVKILDFDTDAGKMRVQGCVRLIPRPAG